MTVMAEKNDKRIKGLEKKTILDALQKSDWIQQDAARLLGVSKRVIHYKIRKYGIKASSMVKNR